MEYDCELDETKADPKVSLSLHSASSVVVGGSFRELVSAMK